MSDYSRMTKAELIEELRRLNEQTVDTAAAVETAVAVETNGSFDEDELFDMVKGQEGDELFAVTETGRFVFVNDTLVQRLGYQKSEWHGMTLARIDKRNTRANWLHRVSQLKRNRIPDEFETEFIDAMGAARPRQVSANYISLRGKNYILCVCSDNSDQQEHSGTGSSVRTREQVFMQATFDGVLLVDTRGTIVDSNMVADRLLLMSKSDILTRSCVDPRWRLVDADGQPLTVSSHPLMIALVEEHPVLNRKIGILQPDGSKRFITFNASPLFDHDGDLSGAIGCMRPFEDSAERNDAMKRDAALAKMQADVVAATLEANSEHDLERNVCDLLVRHMGYPLVWRGVTKPNDMRIHPTASAGRDVDYLRKIKLRYDDSEFGKGPIGKAMKTGQPVVLADISSDPDFEAWRQQTEKSNLHSIAALPLMYDGSEVGIIALYSKDRNHFAGPEYERLKEIARIVAFGIGVRRRIKSDEDRVAEASLKEHMLEAYQSSLPVAFAVFDAKEPFRCLRVNERFSELLDEPFRSRGIEGQYVSDVINSVYHRDLYDRLAEAAEARETQSRSRESFADWKGEQASWSWTITPQLDDNNEGQLLYLAWRHEQTNGDTAEAVKSGPAMDLPVLSPPAECGAVSVIYPKFGPRTKLGTKLQRFLDEGQVTVLTPGAREMLGLIGNAPATAREAFPAAEYIQTLLDTVLVSKESFFRHRVNAAAGSAVDLTVFYSDEGDAQQLWMFVQPAV